MKKVNALTFIISLLISSSCYSQRPILTNTVGMDESQIEVKKSNNSVNLGESSSSVIAKFGNPSSSESFEFEMLDQQGLLLLYGLNRFLFPNNELISFTINSNDFKVGYGGNYISKGDDTSTVLSLFQSANDFKKDTYFKIQLKIGGEIHEGKFLIIDFNPSTNKITKIYIYEY